MKEDLCLYYVREAVQLASQYEEISDTEYFLEEADAKTANNAAVEKGVVASLKRAFDAILQMISEIATKVSNMFQKIFMSKEQKDLFALYEKRIKENPKTANQTVSVTDFKKLDAAYMKALAAGEKAEKEGADPSLGQEIMNALKNNLDKILVSVGVFAALQICKNSKNIARGMSDVLEKEEGLVKALQNKIGKEATDDLKTQTKKYSKQAFWKRWKINLIKHKEETFASKFKKNMSLIASFIPGTKASKDPANKAAKMNIAADMMESPTGRKVLAGGLKAGAKATKIKGDINNMVDKIKGKNK